MSDAPLTAAEARAMLPVVDVADVVLKITKKIAQVARDGKLQFDAESMMPRMAGWDHARAAATRAEIIAALKDLGYAVKPIAGGGHSGGSATLIVDWAR